MHAGPVCMEMLSKRQCLEASQGRKDREGHLFMAGNALGLDAGDGWEADVGHRAESHSRDGQVLGAGEGHAELLHAADCHTCASHTCTFRMHCKALVARCDFCF